MKPISELITHKTVNRMCRNQFGERYYEERTFEMKYNPTIENYALRILAKFIDYFIYFFLALILYRIFNYRFQSGLELILAGLMLLFIFNPYLESKFGKSVGKFILKIQVIDNFANSPSLLLSYKRNFFSLTAAIVLFVIIPVPRRIRFGSDAHNKFCQTYVVFDKNISKIKLFIEKESAVEF